MNIGTQVHIIWCVCVDMETNTNCFEISTFSKQFQIAFEIFFLGFVGGVTFTSIENGISRPISNSSTSSCIHFALIFFGNTLYFISSHKL